MQKALNNPLLAVSGDITRTFPFFFTVTFGLNTCLARAVGKGTVSSGSMQRLEEIVDGIIELDVYEEKEKIWKRMRVRKLRWTKSY
jgi:hypothetical protein